MLKFTCIKGFMEVYMEAYIGIWTRRGQGVRDIDEPDEYSARISSPSGVRGV